MCTGNETIYYKGWTPMPVPGDRGQRSFYVTLTDRYTKKDGATIPLLFSSPKEVSSCIFEVAWRDAMRALQLTDY